ncbi:hypothetical protein BaRGS_00025440 [Batillaria attramentaria]|uniref:Uncharacterized protein n=1 Tax=Batillaria attramentaria TaxID=370345 RepID=A0ABD0K889_9CAEN
MMLYTVALSQKVQWGLSADTHSGYTQGELFCLGDHEAFEICTELWAIVTTTNRLLSGLFASYWCERHSPVRIDSSFKQQALVRELNLIVWFIGRIQSAMRGLFRACSLHEAAANAVMT